MPTQRSWKNPTLVNNRIFENVRRKKEENSPKRTRQQEIIKLRAEINKIETKKTIQKINETKS